MSYAADHLAWKQRVGKEHAVATSGTFGSPFKASVKMPAYGVAELYSQEYSKADPNLMGHYDVKRTLKSLVSGQPIERVFSSPNKINTDRYGRIVGNTTFQTIQKISFSPVSKHPKSLMYLANGAKSPVQKSTSNLIKSASNGALIGARKAKAKPFFEQAYMPKSQVESLSQIGSKIDKIQRSLTKLKPKNREATGELPLLKKERFNEDVISEYSFKIKQKNAHINNVLNNNTELKRMLIKSVESMDAKEIEIMHSALNSAK